MPYAFYETSKTPVIINVSLYRNSTSKNVNNVYCDGITDITGVECLCIRPKQGAITIKIMTSLATKIDGNKLIVTS